MSIPRRLVAPALVAGTVMSIGLWPAGGHAAPATPSLSFTHDITLTTKVACVQGAEFTQFFSTPAIGDLFGDGRKEIVGAFPDGNVHVWYADTYQEAPGWPRYTGDNVASSPTLAVLDGDARPSIIVSSYSGKVNVWDRFGNERPGWPQSTLAGINGGFFASVAVGDVFNDGRKELFATGIDQHTYAWASNGAPLAGWPKLTYDSGLATPALADLQHNGTLSIVTPSDASGYAGVKGGLYWAWDPHGRLLWLTGFNETPWSSPAITDFGDGNYVTVNGTGHFYHQTSNPGAGKYVVGLNQGGSNHGGFPMPANDVSFASPAVGDLLGDGGREVVDVTEAGTVYAMRGDSSQLPGFPLSLPNHNFSAGAAIAPVDGTGRNGIYVPTAGGLAVYSMANLGGPALLPTPGGATPFDTPTIADLGGGHLSVVLGSASGSQNCGQTDTYHLTIWAVNGTQAAPLGMGTWPTFHGNMQRTGANLPPPAPPPPSAHGYWLVASDGGIFPFGNAGGYGSTGGIHLNRPIVGMAGTRDDHGYWLVASDGGIFPFGDAGGYGSTGGIHLNQPIVGMAPTPSGRGYWLVARDGGIFPFGDAGGYGSTGGIHLNQPIVGMSPTADGRGYWLVASDGGIFPFGDAGGYGSTGGIHLNRPIVGMSPTADGRGYWLVASDGGIFPFGDAGGYGSTGGIHLNQPIVDMASSFDGRGYYLVASDGGIFPFGDARGYGSTGGIHLNQPIVSMAATRVTTPGV